MKRLAIVLIASVLGLATQSTAHADFLSKATATFADMTAQLVKARQDVPPHAPSSAPAAKRNKIERKRANIISARLILGDDITTANGRDFGVTPLKTLLSQRAGDTADFPKLTAASVTKLNNLFHSAAPSYVVGKPAKQKWKAFATQLTLMQTPPAP